MEKTIIMILAAAIILLLAALLLGAFFIHQRKLKRHAYLMLEAIRNRDFSFRLSTRGLPFGDKAIQEALNNVGQELRRQLAINEVESWRKLTRVLTHEIMNATAPVTTITQSFLNRKDVAGTPLEAGIQAIYDTTVGLTQFVENYRKLTQLQTPRPTPVCLLPLAESIAELYKHVCFRMDIPPSTVIVADKGMLRQVIVNIVKNAIEAGASNICIAYRPATRELAISNNGSPIPAALRRDIFTPFFTTKQKGSGIGLALSRQIMITQEGDLRLADLPAPDYHVTFVLSFQL